MGPKVAPSHGRFLFDSAGCVVACSLPEVLIGSLGSESQLQLALKLLKDLPKLRYRPDAFTFCQTVKACGEAWQESLLIAAMMASSTVALNEVTFGALLNTQSSSWQRSVDLTYLAMAQLGIETNAIMFNSLIGSFGQDQWMESLTSMEEMAKNFLTPNAFVYSTLLSCCVQAAKWTSALSLWLDVTWLEDGDKTSHAVATGCQKLARVSANEKEKQKNKLKPDVIMYNSDLLN